MVHMGFLALREERFGIWLDFAVASLSSVGINSTSTVRAVVPLETMV